MEDLEKYLKILNSERCLKKPKEAEIILDMISECFSQERSHFTSGLLISLVLDENHSIFSFIWKTCGEYETLPSVVAAFRLLHFLVTSFQKFSEPYFPILFRKCLYLLDAKFARIKEASIRLIRNMIETDSRHCLDVSELVSRLEKHLREDAKIPKTFSDNIYSLLGYLFQKFPESVKNEKWFFGKMFRTLKQESEASKPSLGSVKSALEGINGYLTNYAVPDEETLKKTYECIKKWSKLREDRKAAAQAGLNVLQNHWKHFSSFIYSDKEMWRVNVEVWMRQENANRHAAYKFLCSFYSVIAFFIKQNSNTSELISYTREFTTVLESSTDFWERKAALVGIRLFVLTDSLSGDRFYETYELLAKFIRKEESLKRFKDLPLSVECVSAFVVKFTEENFLTEQLGFLRRLSVRLIESYPFFDEQFRRNVEVSLEKSFYMLGLSKLDLMKNHINQVLYQGLIRTCSSGTLAEAEILKETGQSANSACYKSYLGLWKYLLTLASTPNLPVGGSFTLKKGVAVSVFDAFIGSLLRIVSKLNLSLGPELEVENPSDLLILINIVDLYQDVIPSTDLFNLQKWLVDIFRTVIWLSHKNPLVSGFYTVTAVSLRVADSIQFFEGRTQEKKNCFELVEKFLKCILVKIDQFKGDLQMACFRVLLAAPVVLIEDFAEETVPALEVIAQFARSSFPLLKELMKTLERWDLHLPPSTSGVIMQKILPYFDIFFQSPYFRGNDSMGYSKEGKKLKMELVFNDSELLSLQKKFLIFLGHMEAKRGLSLIEPSEAENRRNISDKQLIYTLPYNKGWIEMNLEEMIPRIVDLAESCGDRRTRLSACELLHSIALLVLGNINQLSGGYKYLFRKVVRSCLLLGCDADGLICQIFEPLMFQIVHYFSGKRALHLAETDDLIDLLFEYVTCRYNPTARDFSAVLLREFTVWSIKQMSPEQLRVTPDNIKRIIQRIYSLALHPSYNKRLGAAIVFNKIYSVLREEEFVLNVYWFQLCYYFMASLRMCEGPEDVTEITDAIKHLERPLEEKHELFNEEFPDRVVPPEFRGGRLCHLVKWTMELAIDAHAKTRHIAMALFEKLAPVVNNCDSSIRFVSKQLKDFLQPGDGSLENFREEDFVGWLKNQTAGFEYCTWLLQQSVLTTAEILQPAFKDVLKHFILSILLRKDKRGVELDKHKQESVLAVLMLLYALKERACLFPREHWELLQTAIFKPSELGFDLYASSATERLFGVLTDFLGYLSINLTVYDFERFYENLESILTLPKFGDLNKAGHVSVENLEFLFALRVVEAAGIWTTFRNRVFFSLQEDQFVFPIFNSLFSSEDKTVYAVALEPSVRMYLEEILGIILKGSTDLKVMGFLENEEEVREEDTGKTVKKGEFFRSVFKNIIFKVLESRHDLLIKWAVNQESLKGMQLLVQVLENRESEDSRLAREIFHRWKVFENIKIRDVAVKNKVLFQLMISGARAVGELGFLKHSPVADRVFAILQKRQFDEMDFPEVEAIFTLLPFFSEFAEGLDENDKLQTCLSEIKIDLNVQRYEEMLKPPFALEEAFKPSQLSRVHFVLGELLKCLRLTGSLVIFNFILGKTAWINALCKRDAVKESLGIFAEDRVPVAHALAALELAYDHCFNRRLSSSPLTVYELYLDPLMRVLPFSVVSRFINEKMKNLGDLVSACWEEEKNLSELLNELLRKTSAARMLQKFFTKASKDDLDELPRENKQTMEATAKRAFLLLKHPAPPTALQRQYRKLMCELFNMICCIISARCVEEKFYKLFIFDERGAFLFKVVDHNVKYNLGMDFEEIPKRKKHLTMLRDAASRTDPTAHPNRYVHTSTLFSSSLQEDVTRFDFTSALIRPPGSAPLPKKNLEIELEMDAFNSHECMATLVATISKMVQDKITPQDDVTRFPCWLKFFLAVLKNEKFSENLKLYVFKAMYNVREYLAPFAKDIFPEFLTAVLKVFINFPMNYFLLDLIEMMLEWGHVPEEETFQQKLTELVEFVLEKSDSVRRDIIGGNLEILKTMIQIWKKGLVLPRLSACVFDRLRQSVTEDLKSDSNADSATYVNIKACGILLSDGIPVWEEGCEEKFLELILKVFQDKYKHILLFGEVCGLVLRHLEKTCPEESRKHEIAVRVKIDSLSSCCMQVLYAVHKNYPKISSFFTFRILSSAWDSTDSLTVKKLEMLLGRVEDPAFGRLGFPFTVDMLNSPDVAVLEVTLELVRKLVPTLDLEKLKVVMKEVLRLQKSAFSGVRKQVYEISKTVFQNGRNDVVGLLCRVILLRGLCDGVRELEDSCLDFWRSVFTSTDFSVLQIVKELYTPETENIFLSNVARVLLRLAGDDPNSQKNIFPHPISLECKFRKRNLILGSRQSFLLSLASSGKTLTNQSLENLATIRRQNMADVRQTPSSLMFEPTAQESVEIAVPEETPGATLLPTNPIKRRFHKNEQKSYFAHAKENRKVESLQKREAEVSIYGQYRDGAYPDIQISHLQIIKLLEVLATRDPQIARLFLVSFYSGSMKTVTNAERKDLLSKTSKCFENMLKSSENYDPGVFGFVLQVILNHNENLDIDPHLISNAAISSNWTSLGALILEHILTQKEEEAPEVPAKRARGNEDPKEKTWLDLAKLYRGLQEFDVVSGIFLDKLNVSPDAKQAIRCENFANWQDALQHYVSVLQSDPDTDQKEFYTESYLSCLAKLSSWSSMNKCIRTTVNEDLDSLWENYYLLSWFAKSEMMISLGADGNDFRAIFEEFCKSPAKRNVLSTNFGEEMTVFDWFSDNFQRANYRIDKLCLDFLTGWSHLDRWSYNLRSAKLVSLQTLAELSFAARNLAEVSKAQVEQNIKIGEKRWGKNVPGPSDDLTVWDVKLGYRRELFKRLKDFDLAAADVRSNLALARAALSQSNLSLTKECLSRAKEKLPKGNFELEVEHNVCFNLGKRVVARAKLKEPNVGLRVYLKVWDEISQQVSSAMKAETSHTLLYTCNFILGLVVSDITSHVDVASVEIRDLIRGRLHPEKDVTVGLKRKGLEYFTKAICVLESANSTPETKAETYLELSKFLLKFPDAENFEILCENLLKSMALGNQEAKELFGCVLNMACLLPEGAPCERLIAQSLLVPSWMFLSWLNQMLATVNSRLHLFLRSVLLRLAQDYPTAIRYALKVMESSQSQGPDTKSIFVVLHGALPRDPLFDNFWDSVKYLASPHMIFRHSLEEALEEARQAEPDYIRISKIISDLKQLMFSADFRNIRGPIFQFWQKFKEPIDDLLISLDDRESLEAKIKILLASAETSKMPSRKTLALLMSYSPWLYNFHALKAEGELELPGQYDGSRPPRNRVSIFQFRNDVLLFDTKCRPMRITVLGNDAREHKFLVKFGDDLRQDERIQRVFQHFNQRLRENRHTRGLCVDTYKVIPLTQNLGMIEWVEDNVSLHDMLENSLGDDSEAIAKAQAAHALHMGQANALLGWETVAFHLNAYERIGRHKAISTFRTRVQEFPRDLLRRCFLDLSTSPQHFLHLRGNFARSHAVMCITHWLIGIGDRHLQNILVSTKTGRVLGVDFGHAFGFATQFLTPPELLPFRLTPQILNVMRPLGESGWIKQTMIHCLRVFRTEGFRLRSVLEVFAEEPVMDWLKQIRKNPNRNSGSLEGWYPREKLSLVDRKLGGANPVAPFEADLLAGHSNSPHLERFLEVLRGDPQDNVRARLGQEKLTEEEQVECLIDLATDQHVLSKTYIGWNPWL